MIMSDESIFNQCIHDGFKFVEPDLDEFNPKYNFDQPFQSLPQNLDLTRLTITRLMLTEYEKINDLVRIRRSIFDIRRLILFGNLSLTVSRSVDSIELMNAKILCLFEYSDRMSNYFYSFQKSYIEYFSSDSNKIYSLKSYEANKESLKSYFFEVCNNLKEAKMKADSFHVRTRNIASIEYIDSLKKIISECDQCYNCVFYAFNNYCNILDSLQIE